MVESTRESRYREAKRQLRRVHSREAKVQPRGRDANHSQNRRGLPGGAKKRAIRHWAGGASYSKRPHPRAEKKSLRQGGYTEKRPLQWKKKTMHEQLAKENAHGDYSPPDSKSENRGASGKRSIPRETAELKKRRTRGNCRSVLESEENPFFIIKRHLSPGRRMIQFVNKTQANGSRRGWGSSGGVQEGVKQKGTGEKKNQGTSKYQ